MEYSVQLEKPSSILRKLTITVPQEIVSQEFQERTAEVQREASVKGFRKGHVPVPMIRKIFGGDIRSRVLEHLINHSYRWALERYQIQPVGKPSVQSGKGG